MLQSRSSRDWSSASIAAAQPGRVCIAASAFVKVCSGWKPPVDAPCSAAADSADTSVAALQWTT